MSKFKVPVVKGKEYEELVQRLVFAASRKQVEAAWSKPKSPEALKLVETVNEDLASAILEYRQKAKNPRHLSPKSLGQLVVQGHAHGDKDLESLIAALIARGFKFTLSAKGFIDSLSSELVEEKKAAGPPPPDLSPKKAPDLSQKIDRAGDDFDFPVAAVGLDAQIKWAYEQSELPGKSTYYFFLRNRPYGPQELVAVNDTWVLFIDGQTGKGLPTIYTSETIRYYNPARDEFADADYTPQEVKKSGPPGGYDPVEVHNGMLSCGWGEVEVNGLPVVIQPTGDVMTADLQYRVQVRNGDDFQDLVNPTLALFSYKGLALMYNKQPCSLDDSWHFTEFGHVVADPERYIDEAIGLLETWSLGGEDPITHLEYLYADLDPLPGVIWTDGSKQEIPLHVSVETQNFNRNLRRSMRAGEEPKAGHFKDCGFHVTVAYYTLNNPYGYHPLNARAYRDKQAWATTDARVKSELDRAGHTFSVVRKMGQDFLDGAV